MKVQAAGILAGWALILAGWCGSNHADAQQRAPDKATSIPRVTFNRDIAPILFHYCAACHRAGESGPFPLMTYNDAKSHARLIEEVTQARIMPPWLPAAEDQKFAEDLRLSDAHIAHLAGGPKAGRGG